MKYILPAKKTCRENLTLNNKKILVLLFSVIFYFLNVEAEENVAKREVMKENFHNVKSFKIEENKFIYVAQDDFHQFIFEYDKTANTIKQISIVWNFIALAKECEGIDQKNIYFAQNKEYYLMGGWDEDPAIRIFDLYNPQPGHNNYLDIVPSMTWANTWCKFYIPLFEKVEKPYMLRGSKGLRL